MFLDYHNILWYYHHVIVFCATPIQAFQSVSEPHTLLSLYFSQQRHYAAEQWAVDFFVFEGTFSPAARMTPAMPSAGASIREDQDVILAFFIYPNAVRLWNIFERWHPHEQKELSRQTLVSVSRRRPTQAETQENGAEGGKIPPQLFPRCTPSDGAAEGIAMAVASESYAPSVLVSTEGLPEKDWLEYRRRGIGGSDAATILGISPFTTARDLYYDKLKIVPFDDSESNWVAKKMGHLLEDLVAEIFHVKTGYRIYQIKKMFYHPVHTFMLADIDYFVELPGGRTAILEIKTTNYNAKDHWWSEDGQEIVPLNYEAQGRHYMAVMNIDEVFYCCLYGNNEDEVIIRHIDRDRDYEAELIALEQDFWENHILTGMPPPYTEDGDLILNSVRRHFGPADPSAPELILEGNMALLIPRYLELQTQRNAEKRNYEHIEAEMRRLQGRIVAEMGRSCTAVCQGREAAYSISYKPVRKSGISKDNLQRLQAQHPDIYEQYVTVSESRRFYVKKRREEAA